MDHTSGLQAFAHRARLTRHRVNGRVSVRRILVTSLNTPLDDCAGRKIGLHRQVAVTKRDSGGRWRKKKTGHSFTTH